MAEGLFAQAMPGRMVCSAGLHALVGEGADSIAVDLMQSRGVDISGHRAQQLASWMVREADLIVTMDVEQQRYIENTWTAARGKVKSLGGARGGIPDPYRQGRRAFQHALAMIEQGMDELLVWMAQEEGRLTPAPGPLPMLQPTVPLPP